MNYLPMKRVLVTGATGFVGGALVRRLGAEPGMVPVAGVRRVPAPAEASVEYLALGDLEDCRVSPQDLQGFSAMVHAAARVHVMHDHAADPLAEFRRVNVQGTLALARAAAAAGVSRFVFLSSVKVNGEASRPGEPIRADDAPVPPSDPYGLSKYEAEQGLRRIADETGMELVIVRPPLVYGPGVRANFLSLMRWLRLGIPLPLSGVDNRRSFVALDNLVDLLVCCVRHPAAANQTLLVSDGDDISTSELLRRLGAAMGRPARLWGSRLVRRLLIATGRDSLVQRLYGSLQLDIDKTRELLGWTPPVRSEQALRETAEHFLRRRAC